MLQDQKFPCGGCPLGMMLCTYYLFNFGLFEVAVSTSDYIASDVKKTNYEFSGYARKGS
jgi:hypothetical protein